MNSKKTLIILLLILAGFAGWYMISPLFIDEEVQEDIPEEFLVPENVVEDPEPELVIDVELETETEVQTPQKDLVDTKPEVQAPEPEPVAPPAPSGPRVTHEANFEKVDYEVTGSYQIIENNGKSLLRIEGLDITNGPDLHFVFSNSNQAFGNTDYINIAALPGNQGSYNVEIPEGVNPDDYQYLLIHCVQFAHTFASANL